MTEHHPTMKGLLIAHRGLIEEPSSLVSLSQEKVVTSEAVESHEMARVVLSQIGAAVVELRELVAIQEEFRVDDQILKIEVVLLENELGDLEGLVYFVLFKESLAFY